MKEEAPFDLIKQPQKYLSYEEAMTILNKAIKK